MRASQIHPGLNWLLVVAAVVSLLPPGSWSLCLDRAGHVAIEPTGLACGESALESADVCGVDTHDACEDFVLFDGQLTTATNPQHVVPAPAVLPDPPFDPAQVASAAHALPAPLGALFPPRAKSSTVIRC